MYLFIYYGCLQGADLEPLNLASRMLPETLAPGHHPATKVSSISTTNVNKGVNVNRFHEVPGKSSIDGTTLDTGKSGGLSFVALAKANRGLQIGKAKEDSFGRLLSKHNRCFMFLLFVFIIYKLCT